MKKSILEAQLRKLYFFGIITEKEYWRLLKKYQEEGLSAGLKKETLALLGKTLKFNKTEENELLKKEDFIRKNLKDLDIHHKKQINEIKVSLVDNRKTKIREIRRQQRKRLADISIQLSQLDRKIKGYQTRANLEVDRRKLADIRKIIQ